MPVSDPSLRIRLRCSGVVYAGYVRDTFCKSSTPWNYQIQNVESQELDLLADLLLPQREYLDTQTLPNVTIPGYLNTLLTWSNSSLISPNSLSVKLLFIVCDHSNNISLRLSGMQTVPSVENTTLYSHFPSRRARMRGYWTPVSAPSCVRGGVDTRRIEGEIHSRTTSSMGSHDSVHLQNVEHRLQPLVYAGNFCTPRCT